MHRKLKRLKKRTELSELWDNRKQSNILDPPKKGEKAKKKWGNKKDFFLNLMKDQEA
jgi:hypothetical protein